MTEPKIEPESYRLGLRDGIERGRKDLEAENEKLKKSQRKLAEIIATHAERGANKPQKSSRFAILTEPYSPYISEKAIQSWIKWSEEE